MKRIIIATLLLLTVLPHALAVIPPPEPYPYTQPDGSVVMLTQHGDEFHHWITCNGVAVKKDAAGYYRPYVRPRAVTSGKSATRRAQAASARRSALKSDIGMGERRFLVILVEFSDLPFSIPSPNAAFTNLLNQNGYSYNGGTGSVKDFYTDNSAGVFVPSFDVYGPVTLENGYAYYGGNDEDGGDLRPDAALAEACDLLDEEIDFSKYDLDGDGYVDNVFFYYAGHNEAEGGGEDTIWPHQWSLYRYSSFHDGVKVFRYACSSEYKGVASASVMCGIGTFVHEFGHVLGLPDFYDTDYDQNGSARHPGAFSTMAGGNYANGGNTPVNFTSVERQMLGWMGCFNTLSSSGAYSLGGLSGNNLPYVSKADVDGEDFIYEFRDGTGWDRYLPTGIVVYHRDASLNICHDNVSAEAMWSTNSINNYAVHPCLYLFGGSRVYPGEDNTVEIAPRPWSGADLPYYISNIQVGGGVASFNYEQSENRKVFGTVRNSDGTPLEGAVISLFKQQASASGKARRKRSAPPGEGYTAVTGADGSYEILLGGDDTSQTLVINASFEGYIDVSRNVEVRYFNREDFVLRPIGSAPFASLQKFDLSGSPRFSKWGFEYTPQSVMSMQWFTSEELTRYAGMQISSLSFRFDGTKATGIYAIVCSESKILYSQRIPSSQVNYGGFSIVDISDAGITIPTSGGIGIGYALSGVDSEYPVLVQEAEGANGFNIANFNMDSPTWMEQENYLLLVSATLFDEGAAKYATLGSMGFNAIDNPQWESGYKAGESFSLQLASSNAEAPTGVKWYFDGVQTGAKSVTLTSGAHVVKAILSYADGTSETLVLELDAE